MRAFTKVQQARKDKAERIFMPSAQIFVRTKNELNVDTLNWGLQSLITNRPWRDSRWYEHDQRIPRPYGSPDAFEVQGMCEFAWREGANGGFYSHGEKLYLRRGQMLAFENWVQALVHGLANLPLPHIEIHDVRGTVSYFRHIEYVQPDAN